MSERLSITKNGAKLNEAINKTLEEIKASGTFKEERVITSKQAAEIAVEGREEKVLNFCANNYLGLANSPELIQAAKESLDSHGFGLASVRFICGTTDIHKQLEALIAKFHGMEDCILYSSCFDANGGFFEALFNAEDAVISDQLNHASIIDGIRLCKAQRHRYNHMDMQHLEKILQEPQNCRYRCIVTDGVFSMDGDVAPLDRLVDLKKRYPGVMLYVDEAHGIGVRGRSGLGVAEEQGCLKDIDFLCGTFGKALASVGAYVVCSEVMRSFLVNRMRTFIFTTALPPLNVAWTKFILSRLGGWNDRRERLAEAALRVQAAVRGAGRECPSSSHIVPFIVGESNQTILKAEDMQRKGFYVLPVRPPTVPEGTSRLRISLTAAVTEEEVDSLCRELKRL